MRSSPTLRDAVEADVPLILSLIRELAEYEKLLHEVEADEATLRRNLFSETPKAYVVIAEVDGKPAGFMLFFYDFSTFLGKPGLYIEDLYVREAYRGNGIGRAFFQWLARKAVKEDCGRLEWWVLDWNQPAIDFYKRLGAEPMDDWTVYRMDGEELKALAA